MPIQSCKKNSKSGYKFGPTGTCYTYTTERGRLQAIEKAERQGRAVAQSQGKKT